MKYTLNDVPGGWFDIPPGDGRVRLHLPNSVHRRTRTIGYIVGDTFIKEQEEKDLFRNLGDAIGICYDLLRVGTFRYVVVEILSDGKRLRTLRTTRENFLEHGKFRFFKRNGLERRIFLTQDKFDTLAISKPKHRRASGVKTRKSASYAKSKAPALRKRSRKALRKLAGHTLRKRG